MNTNNLFTWVWRINGLIFLAAAILLSAFIVYSTVADLLRENSDNAIIHNVADDPDGDEKWILGVPTEITGTSFIAIPLVSENDEINNFKNNAPTIISEHKDAQFYSGSGGYSGTAKNVLFVNGALNQSHWLFPDNRQIVISFEQLPYYYTGADGAARSKLIFYKVITSDNDGDGTLSDKDNIDLAVSTLEGRNYKTIVENIDRVLSQSLAGESDMIVIYQKAGVGYSLKLNIPTLKVSSKRELPKVGEVQITQ